MSKERNNVYDLLRSFEPISLKGLEEVKLLDRIDMKYVISIQRLPEIIQLLKDQAYVVLEIDGRRTFNYKTTYFDTPKHRLFKDHHNKLLRRLKVRTRSYIESNNHFFEIKLKSKSRTKKFREKLRKPNDDLTEKQIKRVNEISPRALDAPLKPTLTNSYTRITFTNKARTERCTIDINLSYREAKASTEEIFVDDIAIVEVKQSKTSLLGGIVASLRSMKVYPTSFSKYVYGTIQLYPDIKHNLFKPLLHKIDGIRSQTQRRAVS